MWNKFGISDDEYPLYNVKATEASKAAMFFSTITCIGIMIFSSWGFKFWWLCIIPVFWFLSSVIAFPFFYPRWLIAIATARRFAEGAISERGVLGLTIICHLIDVISAAVTCLVTYYGSLWFYKNIFM